MQTVIGQILVNYEVSGIKNKRTVLILHGWGQSLNHWKNVSQMLSEKYKVVTVDLPGFGSSTLPPCPFGLDEYSEFVSNFIRKLDLKKFALIGHSFGGKIAIDFASKNKLLDTLILISPSGVGKRSVLTILKIFLARIFKKIPFLPNLLASRDYREAGDLKETFKKVVGKEVKSQAKKINTKTIIVWGEKDGQLRLKNAKILKKLIKNSILRVIWGVGHSPNIEAPNKLVNLIFEYL